jgi:hypothetical protein
MRLDKFSLTTRGSQMPIPSYMKPLMVRTVIAPLRRSTINWLMMRVFKCISRLRLYKTAKALQWLTLEIYLVRKEKPQILTDSRW